MKESRDTHKGNLVVVDVRDSSAFPETGTVQGALQNSSRANRIRRRRHSSNA